MPVCRLCEKIVDKLIDSHLLPRAAYRQINSNGKKTVQVKIADNDAFYCQKQVSADLLCLDCEDLFSKKGESQMGLLWMNSKEFPLLNLLKECNEISSRCYDGSHLPKEIFNALSYFAISVIWRANVWPDKTHKYQGSLGKTYEPLFRAYLLNDTPIKNIKHFISINSSHQNPRCKILVLPKMASGPLGKIHFFYVLGISFSIFVGRTPDNLTKGFEELDSNMLLSVTEEEDSNWQQELQRKVQFELTRRGKLAVDYPI